ncbi:hypothetical protein QAD02_021739 [Eretmocerus hayati]|uniref:Uncharacterized protein n=1 Tax=Eretmocerus hayati TaxID=131215 RepID=A0ACC2PT01_9HYME|nr:hypothetical protein QAD02_021739 [Eretmocerus hayati]
MKDSAECTQLLGDLPPVGRVLRKRSFQSGSAASMAHESPTKRSGVLDQRRHIPESVSQNLSEVSVSLTPLTVSSTIFGSNNRRPVDPTLRGLETGAPEIIPEEVPISPLQLSPVESDSMGLSSLVGPPVTNSECASLIPAISSTFERGLDKVASTDGPRSVEYSDAAPASAQHFISWHYAGSPNFLRGSSGYKYFAYAMSDVRVLS